MTRLTEIVDIGANPIEGNAPYKRMLDAGAARVTGFEPQAQALAALQAVQGPNERYFPYVVGDGTRRTFNVCAYSGMSSFLEPDANVTRLHGGLHARSQVIERVEVETRRLDDIDEIERIDLLKIDVQGAELDVFRGGEEKLKSCVAIWTEAAFMPFYKGQPSFGEIDVELRRQGFAFHTFKAPKGFVFGPEPDGGAQLIDGDMLYVRDFTRPDLMSADQLEQLSLIAQHVFGSVGLARLVRQYWAERGQA